MNAGLSNLSTLKRELLADLSTTETKWDSTILLIGLGVAGMFNRETNRELPYEAADTYEWDGMRRVVFVPRYPLYSVSKVEQRYQDADAWELLADEPVRTVCNTGAITVASALSSYRVRATYSGGYWVDTNEPEDGVGAPPEGIQALPHELRAAFMLQCRKIWESIDKSGEAITKVGSGATFVTESLGGLELVPLVRAVLNSYRRFN